MRIQFSILSCLALVTVVAVLVAFWRAALTVILGGFYWLVVAAVLAVSVWATRRTLVHSKLLPLLFLAPTSLVLIYASIARVVVVSPGSLGSGFKLPGLEFLLETIYRFWRSRHENIGNDFGTSGMLETAITVALTGLVAAAILGLLVGVLTSTHRRITMR